MNDLPPGWAGTTVGEIAASLIDGPFGSNLKSEHYQPTGARVIRLQNIADGRFGDRDKAYISLSHFNSLNRHEARPGDVLIAALGDVLPRVCLVPPDIGPAIVKADCFRLRPHQGISGSYIAYILSSPQIRKRASAEIAGVGRPRLNLRKVSALPIPIAPSAEQHRIVAAIEEQFSRLDTAAATLTSAQRRLQQLRDQGIFALTKGKGSKVRLAEICEIRLGRQRSPKNHSGPNMVSYLRAANVAWEGLDLTDVKQMNFTPSEVSNYRLQRGDVLVAEASGSASEVGKPAIWDEGIPVCCFQNTLLRLRSEHLLPEYLYFVLLGLARSGAFARASRGVGIHHLSKAGIADVMIEVPSLKIQRELVATIIDQQEQYAVLGRAISMGLQRASRLRASVLAAAFSGRLAPQDPSDEPASIVLERIAAERASSNGCKARPTRKPGIRGEKVTA